MLIYPQPGTHAERVLEFIQKNPGTTRNAIIRSLALNPSIVRDCIRQLSEKGIVVDTPDSQNHHHYKAKTPVL